jgi:hypothetical protein
MSEYQAGSGERIERRNRVYKVAVIAVLFGFGMLVGMYMAHSGGGGLDALLGPEQIMPAWVAIAISTMFFVAIIAGAVVLQGHTDEHDRLNKYKAASLAGTAYLTTYMVWFFLWKGGLLPEPMHIVLFLVFLVTMFSGIAFYRFR